MTSRLLRLKALLPLFCLFVSMLSGAAVAQGKHEANVKAVATKVLSYIKGLETVLLAERRAAEAELVGALLEPASSNRAAVRVKAGDLDPIYNNCMAALASRRSFVETVLKDVAAKQIAADALTRVYDYLEGSLYFVVEAHVELAKFKLKLWHTSDYQFWFPQMSKWGKASRESTPAELEAFRAQFTKECSVAFESRLQAFKKLQAKLLGLRKKVMLDARRWMRFANAHGGGFSDLQIVDSVELGERMTFFERAGPHTLANAFSKDRADYVFTLSRSFPAWKPPILDPAIQRSPENTWNLFLYSIFDEPYKGVQPGSWDIVVWSPEAEAALPEVVAEPEPEAKKVTYRAPFPRAIWGVMDISPDELPQWVATMGLGRQKQPGQIDPFVAERWLFVYGHGLSGSGAPSIVSQDDLLQYEVMDGQAGRAGIVPAGPIPSGFYAPEWRIGWTWAMMRSPIEDDEFCGQLEGVLLRVPMKIGTMKGIKGFTFNGLKAVWPLTKSRSSAIPTFVRPVGEAFEWSDVFFIPDRFCVEVHTSDLALQQIPIVIIRDGKPVQFGNETVLVANKVAPKLYRTQPVQTFPENRPPANFAPGVKYAYFKPGQTVTAVVRHTIGTARTQTAEAKVHLTTANVGAYWKDALHTALTNSGYVVDKNWGDIVPKEAMERKVVGTKFTSVELRPTGLTVGDHAAMILMRRVFVEMMREHVGLFERLLTPAGANAAPGVIKQLPKSHALSQMMDKEIGQLSSGTPLIRFGIEQDEVRMRQLATKCIAAYLPDMRSSLQKAEAVKNGEVLELLKITGYGFGRVEQRLMPRLMTISNDDGTARQMWVPEVHARQHVLGLGYVAQRIRADKEIADASKQLALCVASLFPVFTAPASVLRVALSVGLALADVADLGMEVAQQYGEWQEYTFARAAADILDGERVDRAQMEKPSLWGNLIAGAVVAVGLRFDMAEAVDVARAQLPRRLPALAAKIDLAADPIAAMRKLDVQDQIDTLVGSSQALMKRASGGSLSNAETKLIGFRDQLTEAVIGTVDSRPKATPDGVALPESRPHAAHAKPKGNAIEAVRVSDAAYPQVGAVVTARGKSFKLGECLCNTSAYFTVYEALDAATGKPLGKVIKIAKNKDSAAAEINRTVRGAKTLERAKILHARIDDADLFLDAPQPFFLQKLLVPSDNLILFTEKNINTQWTIDHMKAALQLYQDLAKKDVLWYDGHYKNMYFEKGADQIWRAGVLDSDYMHFRSEAPENDHLASRLASLELLPQLTGINSMNGAPLPDLGAGMILHEATNKRRVYPSAALFMEKMLEHRGWISYDADKGKWFKGLVSPELAEKYFPGLMGHVRYDLSKAMEPPPEPEAVSLRTAIGLRVDIFRGIFTFAKAPSRYGWRGQNKLAPG